MRRIDLSDYDVEYDDEKGEVKTTKYMAKKSLVNMLYSQDIRLTAMELLDNDRVAQKIKGSDGVVLLEEEEYGKVKHALECLRGLSKQDVPLVKRVLEAPQVEVAEK
jgi:hypothetical protein